MKRFISFCAIAAGLICGYANATAERINRSYRMDSPYLTVEVAENKSVITGTIPTIKEWGRTGTEQSGDYAICKNASACFYSILTLKYADGKTETKLWGWEEAAENSDEDAFFYGYPSIRKDAENKLFDFSFSGNISGRGCNLTLEGATNTYSVAGEVKEASLWCVMGLMASGDAKSKGYAVWKSDTMRVSFGECTPYAFTVANKIEKGDTTYVFPYDGTRFRFDCVGKGDRNLSMQEVGLYHENMYDYIISDMNEDAASAWFSFKRGIDNVDFSQPFDLHSRYYSDSCGSIDEYHVRNMMVVRGVGLSGEPVVESRCKNGVVVRGAGVDYGKFGGAIDDNDVDAEYSWEVKDGGVWREIGGQRDLSFDFTALPQFKNKQSAVVRQVVRLHRVYGAAMSRLVGEETEVRFYDMPSDVLVRETRRAIEVCDGDTLTTGYKWCEIDGAKIASGDYNDITLAFRKREEGHKALVRIDGALTERDTFYIRAEESNTPFRLRGSYEASNSETKYYDIANYIEAVLTDGCGSEAAVKKAVSVNGRGWFDVASGFDVMPSDPAQPFGATKEENWKNGNFDIVAEMKAGDNVVLKSDGTHNFVLRYKDKANEREEEVRFGASAYVFKTESGIDTARIRTVGATGCESEKEIVIKFKYISEIKNNTPISGNEVMRVCPNVSVSSSVVNRHFNSAEYESDEKLWRDYYYYWCKADSAEKNEWKKLDGVVLDSTPILVKREARFRDSDNKIVASDFVASTNVIRVEPFKGMKAVVSRNLADLRDAGYAETDVKACYGDAVYVGVRGEVIEYLKKNPREITPEWTYKNEKDGESKRPYCVSESEGLFVLKGNGAGMHKVIMEFCTMTSNEVTYDVSEKIDFDAREDMGWSLGCNHKGDTLRIDEAMNKGDYVYKIVGEDEEETDYAVLDLGKQVVSLKKAYGDMCYATDTIEVAAYNGVRYYPLRLTSGERQYEKKDTIAVCAETDYYINTVSDGTEGQRYAYYVSEEEHPSIDEKTVWKDYAKNAMRLGAYGVVHTLYRRTQSEGLCETDGIDTFYVRTYAAVDLSKATFKDWRAGTVGKDNNGTLYFGPYCNEKEMIVHPLYLEIGGISGGSGKYKYAYGTAIDAKGELTGLLGNRWYDYGKDGASGTPYKSGYYLRVVDKVCPLYVGKHTVSTKNGNVEKPKIGFLVISEERFNNWKSITVEVRNGKRLTDLQNIEKVDGECPVLKIREAMEDWFDESGINTVLPAGHPTVTMNSRNYNLKTYGSLEIASSGVYTNDFFWWNLTETTSNIYLRRFFRVDDNPLCETTTQMPVHCTNGWENTDVFKTVKKGKGISEEEGATTFTNRYIGCVGKTDTLYLATKSGEKELTYGDYTYTTLTDPKGKYKDDVTYQWQMKKVQLETWTTIKGATNDFLEFTVTDSAIVLEYRCVVSYDGAQVASSPFYVTYDIPTQYIRDEKGLRERTVCLYGDSGEVELKADSLSGASKNNAKYVWKYKVGDVDYVGTVWKTLTEDEDADLYLSDADAPSTTLKYKPLTDNVRIKCDMVFSGCAKETVVGSMAYRLKMDSESDKYPIAGNVELASSPIFSGNVVDSLVFVVRNQGDAAYSSYFLTAPGAEEGTEVVSAVSDTTIVSSWRTGWGLGTMPPAPINYYRSGKFKIYTQKMNSNGCRSKVDSFSYTLYDELWVEVKVPEKLSNKNNVVQLLGRCIGDTLGYIKLDIYGGDKDALPNVKLYVGLEGAAEDEFVELDEAVRKGWIMYQDTTIQEIKAGPYTVEHYQYSINNITQTRALDIFAEVTRGKYPGKVRSAKVISSVYGRVNAGAIALADDAVCIGDSIQIDDLVEATGGELPYWENYVASLNLFYMWYKKGASDADWIAMDENWGYGYRANGYRHSTYRTDIQEKTIFKRKVKMWSDYCGKDNKLYETYYMDESDPIVVTPEEAFRANTRDYVEISNNARSNNFITGKDEIEFKINSNGVNAQRYVYEISEVLKEDSLWSNLEGYIAEPNVVAPEIGEQGDVLNIGRKSESKSYYYTVQAVDKNGCRATNKDTFVVNMIGGGRIGFEDDHSKKSGEGDSKYWVCPNGKLGKICGREDEMDYEGRYGAIDCNARDVYWHYKRSDSEVGSELICSKNPPAFKSGAVITPSVNLDTTNIDLSNTTDGVIEVRIWRETFVSGISQTALSDTLIVEIAPTLPSGILRSLSAAQEGKCSGNEGVVFTAVLDSTMDYLRNAGAIAYSGEFKTEWMKRDEEGEWYRFDAAESRTLAKEYKYSYPRSIEQELKAKFVLTDGCATVEDTVSVKPRKEGTEGEFVILVNGAVRDYIEEGDEVMVNYSDADASVKWYSDADCGDCEVAANAFGAVVYDQIGADARLYMAVVENGGDAVCERMAVPMVVRKKSDGGKIEAPYSRVCDGGWFPTVRSVQKANGGGISDDYDDDSNFAYEWQYSGDGEEWNRMEGMDSYWLDELLFNDVEAIGEMPIVYVRRVATNEGGRSVFSNVVKFDRYEPFVAGEIGFVDGSNGRICYSDLANAPKIVSSAPTGGKGAETGYMSFGWEVAYDEYGYTYIYDDTLDIAKFFDEYIWREVTEDITLRIKREYSDGMCGYVESNTLDVVVYSNKKKPAAYMSGDNCEDMSSTVCMEDAENFAYKWWAVDSDGVQSEEYAVRNCTVFDGATNNSAYIVMGENKETGCKTDTVHVSLSTVPRLQQQEDLALDTFCHNGIATIDLPSAIGGVGEKSYKWESSVDGEEWNVIEGANTAQIEYENEYAGVKKIFVRRIVMDACKSLVTNPIEVNYYDSITAIEPVVKNFQCSGKKIPVSVDDSLIGDKYIRFYDELFYNRYFDAEGNVKIEEEEMFNVQKDHFYLAQVDAENDGQLSGFSDETKKVYYVTFSHNGKCMSKFTEKLLIRKPVPDADNLSISASDLNPCSGTEVTVTGKSAYPVMAAGVEIDPEKDDLEYNYLWMVRNGSSNVWAQQKERGLTLNLLVKDSAGVYLMVDGTCGVGTIISNKLFFTAQKVEKFEPTMDVFTSYADGDGEVTVTSSSFENCVLSTADGTVIDASDIANGVKLPYSAYACCKNPDSAIYVSRTDVCVKPYKITPIYGMYEGRLSVNCKNHTIGSEFVNFPDYPDPLEHSTIWYNKQTEDDEWEVATKGGLPYVTNYLDSYLKCCTSYTVADGLTYLMESKPVHVNFDAPIVSPLGIDEARSNSYGIVGASTVMKNPNDTIVLYAEVRNEKTAVWEVSEDGDNWDKLGKASVVHDTARLVVDSDESLYYRLATTNGCGETNTEALYVQITELQFIEKDNIYAVPALCSHANAYIQCYDDNSGATGDYVYKYEFEVGEGGSIAAYQTEEDMAEEYAYDGGFLSNGGVWLMDVVGDVWVHITRFDPQTLQTSIADTILRQETIRPEFSMSINDGERVLSSEEVMADGAQFEIQQGDKILFENNCLSADAFAWNFSISKNPFVDNTDGRYDVASSKNSPTLYFYSEGLYSVSLTASNSICSNTLRIDNLLKLQSESVRIFAAPKPSMMPMVELEEGVDETEYAVVAMDVYPIPFDEELNIVLSNTEFVYSVVGENGVIWLTGEAMGSVRLNTSRLPRGGYVVIVNGAAVKAVK